MTPLEYFAATVISGLAVSKINWTVVYLWAAFTGSFALIAVNQQTIRKWNQKRKEVHEKEWDMTSDEAITYIIRSSHYGRSLNASSKIEGAVKAFVDAAAKGKLSTVGRLPGEAAQKPIPASDWKKYATDMRLVSDDFGRTASTANLTLREVVGNKRETRFEGIMVDSDDVEIIWRR